EDRKKSPGVYALRDMIGRSGVERAMEKTLRGKAGKALFVRDDRGHRRLSEETDDVGSGEAFERAVPGNDVWLALDMELQKEVSRSFRYYKSGGAVMLDVDSGGVLALYSKPGFDPNVWSGRLTREVWEETNANPYTPLINKAVSPYAPGSVYKIVTGLAGLTEETVTAETTIDCSGFYEYGGRRFHCHYLPGHGSVNLTEALKYSCDVYFYRLGEMLGMDTLAEYGALLGYGELTGVQIGERRGRLPTRHWHAEETSLGWQPGFTLSTAIGQGSLTASPLQVAKSYVAMANGGELLDLNVVDRCEDEDGSVTRRFERSINRTLPFAAMDMAVVHQGLVDVVNAPDGTASEMALETILMAGKTGTAEAAQMRRGASPEMKRWLEEDHAWFAAYAPADDPKIVVVVFVEHGGSGSKRAAPIARRIVQSWERTQADRPDNGESP
ncbi:MAG: penicillin-binding transpeptidase domain-containing protein, partial [Myxococcota bacterium]|nr:penicillin-binding transpeptidase domain-containing protein [Myxococcota bacterium]